MKTSSLWNCLNVVVFVSLLSIYISFYQSTLIEPPPYQGPFGADCDPDSGWNCDYAPPFSHRNGDHHFCDLDVMQLSDGMDEFFSKCYLKMPCVINTTLEDWTNASFWNKEAFLAAYGNHSFDAGKSIKLVLKAGVGKERYTLNEYLALQQDYREQEPMYIFDRTIWSEESRSFQANHFRDDNISFFKFGSEHIKFASLFSTHPKSETVKHEQLQWADLGGGHNGHGRHVPRARRELGLSGGGAQAVVSVSSAPAARGRLLAGLLVQGLVPPRLPAPAQPLRLEELGRHERLQFESRGRRDVDPAALEHLLAPRRRQTSADPRQRQHCTRHVVI